MSQLTIDQAFQTALAHHQAGHLAEAELLYRQILTVQPNHADTLHMLGVLAGQTGHSDDAIHLIRQALALNPGDPIFHFNLSTFLQNRMQLDEAIIHLCEALALHPDYPEAQYNLGHALKNKEQFQEAITSFQQAAVLKPDYLEAHNSLGNILQHLGRHDEAIVCYQRVLSLNPEHFEAHNNLGTIWREKGRLDQAMECFERARALNPLLAETHSNLGNIWKDKQNLDKAIACYQLALNLNPNLVLAYNNLGATLREMGRLDEAVACYRKALILNPNLTGVHDNLLVALQYHPSSTPQNLFTEYQRWNQVHAQPLRPFIQPHHNDPNPSRPIRLGYISPDFLDHPVGRFLFPLLASHDHTSFQIFCYANVYTPDSMTEKLKEHTQTWRSIVDLSAQQIAELIRGDQIDILVDLTMHAANNNLLILARKPTPVQITYLAYAGGTALGAIDYRLTDPYLDPDESEDSYYMEKAFRVKGTYWCYQANSVAPPVNELPAINAKTITLGCFNNFCKVTAPTLKLWTDLLQNLPNTRLLLHAPPGSPRDTLRQFMQDYDISSDRVDFAGGLSLHDYFHTYHRIDIALDPFPFNGGTTTCDALWMGVPVITLQGRTPVGRAGVSILSHLGLPELIAHTPEQYIQIAADLANDLPRLAQLRATLRQRMLNSSLMDAPRFARSIEQAYRTMWQTWCEEQQRSNKFPPTAAS